MLIAINRKVSYYVELSMAQVHNHGPASEMLTLNAFKFLCKRNQLIIRVTAFVNKIYKNKLSLKNQWLKF